MCVLPRSLSRRRLSDHLFQLSNNYFNAPGESTNAYSGGAPATVRNNIAPKLRRILKPVFKGLFLLLL